MTPRPTWAVGLGDAHTGARPAPRCHAISTEVPVVCLCTPLCASPRPTHPRGWWGHVTGRLRPSWPVLSVYSHVPACLYVGVTAARSVPHPHGHGRARTCMGGAGARRRGTGRQRGHMGACMRRCRCPLGASLGHRWPLMSLCAALAATATSVGPRRRHTSPVGPRGKSACCTRFCRQIGRCSTGSRRKQCRAVG